MLLVVLFSALPMLAEECMDCVQRQVEHDDPGHIWFSSDALCCDAPCVGEGYEIKDENVGWGCRIMAVNNVL
ncbi:MAG TPA: hypothetical protein VN181_06015, partial [Thermoanaerobaculia bacterium]|nr:hypothetical protein [Thermoanaerobaculia bacterium]